MAAPLDTATPSQPYLAFNPAAVGIAPASAQQLTASFSVTGSDMTVSAPASLAPGQSVVLNVEFKDPSSAAIHFTPVIPVNVN
jgi:hypothetical protein